MAYQNNMGARVEKLMIRSLEGICLHPLLHLLNVFGLIISKKNYEYIEPQLKTPRSSIINVQYK